MVYRMANGMAGCQSGDWYCEDMLVLAARPKM